VLAQSWAAISLILLGAAGVAKMTQPLVTSGALLAMRLPSHPSLVRALGLAELGVAIAGLAIAGPWVYAAAIFYLGFSVFVLSAISRQTPLQSCGCFGTVDTPPTRAHLVYNLVSAVALIWVGFEAGPVVAWDQPGAQLVLFVLFAGLGAYLSYLILGRLPQTWASATR
jgi:Methylamine utilisation protein MauE